MFNLDNLILARLLTGRPDGDTQASVSKSLEAFFLHRLSRSAWNTLFSARTAQLGEFRLIESKGNRLRLTPEGQRQALAFLTRDEPLVRIPWTALKNVDLIAIALQLPMPRGMLRQRLGSAGGLRAAILRRHYNLPIDIYPTLTQTQNALLWRQLTSPRLGERLTPYILDKTGKPFVIKTVSVLLLNDLLGSHQATTPRDALNQLVARAVNARRIDVAELRLAILRSAVDASESRGIEPPPYLHCKPNGPEKLCLARTASGSNLQDRLVRY